MKIAIVCDWLVSVGGAEKLLEQLIKCFPSADLFAVVDFVADHERAFLQDKKITTTFIQRLPFAKKKYRSYLPFMPLAIEQLDVSGYDIIISSSHAVAKGVITGPNQLHVSYVHSPMRYAWDLQHQYLHETGLDKKWSGWLAKYFLHKLRLWDLRSASNVDYFIANSKFIAKRIQKTYRRDAFVIHPPIELTRYQKKEQKEHFYLAASRLVPYKKMDLIAESFKAMPDRELILIGDGPDYQKVKSKSGPNVKFLGYQPTSVLIDYMQRANALIFAAEEDFGLVPVEAQACGTPVIAYGKGGALETVRGVNHAEPTGLFFQEQTCAAICEAVQTFEANRDKFKANHCVQHATFFSAEYFQRTMANFVAEKWREFEAR